MTLTETIEDDLKIAMKAKDALKLSTLRMLKTAIKNKAIENKSDSLDDKDVGAVVQKEVKKRQESKRAYDNAGREELAAKEAAEADILAAYMPTMMTELELIKIVEEVIATGQDNFGLVMKEVMAKAAGQADGQVVQRLVKKKMQT